MYPFKIKPQKILGHGILLIIIRKSSIFSLTTDLEKNLLMN